MNRRAAHRLKSPDNPNGKDETPSRFVLVGMKREVRSSNVKGKQSTPESTEVRMNRFLFSILLIATMIASAFAVKHANVNGNRDDVLLRRDANGDGKLTVMEFTENADCRYPEHAAVVFSKLDRDGNSEVTQEEIQFAQARRMMKAKQRLDEADTDNDGLISKSEFIAMKREGHGDRSQHFKNCDTSGNGAIELDEWKAFGKEREVGKLLAPSEDGFREADANADGGVSEDEMRTYMDAKIRVRKEDAFLRMDRDRDGFLTREEMREGMQERRGGKGGKRSFDSRESTRGAVTSNAVLEEGVELGTLALSNYPNPFNSSTTISYELAKDSDVSLKVFNTLGQEVATLVDGPQTAKRYDVKFGMTGLTTGMYFYKLQTSDASELQRMLYIR